MTVFAADRQINATSEFVYLETGYLIINIIVNSRSHLDFSQDS